MLLTRVKSIFEQKIKTVHGQKAPENDVLAQLCHEGMLFVAGKSVPSELLRCAENTSGESVYRLLENGNYIVEPEYPDFSSTVKHMMIDEELSYAVINKMAALYSTNMNDVARFENEALRLINTFKANARRVVMS